MLFVCKITPIIAVSALGKGKSCLLSIFPRAPGVGTAFCFSSCQRRILRGVPAGIAKKGGGGKLWASMV